MSWRSLIDWALRPLFDFAGDCWAREYATGAPRRAPSMLGFGDDEAAEAIMLGGCSLAEELRCHRSGPRNADLKSLFHDTAFAIGEQHNHA